MTAKHLVLIIFLVTYTGLICLPKRKTITGAIGALLMLLVGALPLGRIYNVVDWNVLLMIFGTGGVVMMFIESRVPEFLSDHIIDRTPNVKWATISIALFTGIISAFLENVSTLLIVAPIAFEISRKLRISPVPMLITISISSNLQGAATLVGDPTSIMLGGYADMNFLDFFFMQGKLGIFFAVELGALAATVVMYFMFRKQNQPIRLHQSSPVKDWFPAILLCGMILLLIGVSFLSEKPAVTNGLICASALVIGVVREIVAGKRLMLVRRVFRETDWHTLGLLVCLFIIIGSLVEVGIVADIAALIAGFGGDNTFVLYTIIVWVSVIASAFIDNIPYVATMLPVVGAMANQLGISPYVFYFGLLSGATLGGNISPIGASTNIAALGLLRRHGYNVGFGTFARYGLPFTLSAVTAGYVFLWLVWG